MLTEILQPPNTIARIREIEAQGGRIFRMSEGDRLCDWKVMYFPKELASPQASQQQEMFEIAQDD